MYCQNTRIWSLTGMWETRMRKISWWRTRRFDTSWKHSHSAVAFCTPLELPDVFNLCAATEQSVAPTNSSNTHNQKSSALRQTRHLWGSSHGLVWSVSCFIPQLAYCIIHNFPTQLRILAKYVQLMQKITYHNQLHNKLYNVIPHLWSINIPRVQKQHQFWHEYIYIYIYVWIRLNYEGLGRTCFKIREKQPTHIASPAQTVCFEHQWAYLSRVNRKIKQSSGQHRDTVAEPETVTLYTATVKKIQSN